MASELQGFEDLTRKLKRLGKSLGGKTLRQASMSATLPVLQTARANAPVGDLVYTYDYGTHEPYPKRTHKGRLVGPGFGARSLARKSLISPDATRVTVLIGPRPEAFYMTQFVELGTSRQEPQPFLEPALRSNQSAVISRLRTILKRKIDRVAR